MSFVDALNSDNGQKVFLVTGNENGNSAWYYVQVERKKLPFYQKAIKSGNLDLREYGDIIECGWGDEPPNDVVQEMQEQYG